MAAASQADQSPFLDPNFMEDPYPALAKFRAEDPVHWVPLGGCGANRGGSRMRSPRSFPVELPR